MRNRTPQGAKNYHSKADSDRVDAERREALRTIGQFAVYVAPAMTVLLKGHPAGADHNSNSNPGHGQGRCTNKPWLSVC